MALLISKWLSSALILSLSVSLSTCQLQQFNGMNPGGGFNSGFYQYPYYQNGFFPSIQQQQPLPLNSMSYTYPYGGGGSMGAGLQQGPMMMPQQQQQQMNPMAYNGGGGGGMYPIYQPANVYSSRPGEINVDVKTPVGGPTTTVIEKPIPVPIRETEVIREPVHEPPQPIIKHIEQYTWGRDGLRERYGITPILQGMELVDQPKQRSTVRFQHIPRPFYVQKPQHFEQYEYGKRK